MSYQTSSQVPVFNQKRRKSAPAHSLSPNFLFKRMEQKDEEQRNLFDDDTILNSINPSETPTSSSSEHVVALSIPGIDQQSKKIIKKRTQDKARLLKDHFTKKYKVNKATMRPAQILMCNYCDKTFEKVHPMHDHLRIHL